MQPLPEKESAEQMKSVAFFYISTRVTIPCRRLAGSLLNCTKLGVTRLIRLNSCQIGLRVTISSTP